jgi:hypothetical protein
MAALTEFGDYTPPAPRRRQIREAGQESRRGHADHGAKLAQEVSKGRSAAEAGKGLNYLG